MADNPDQYPSVTDWLLSPIGSAWIALSKYVADVVKRQFSQRSKASLDQLVAAYRDAIDVSEINAINWKSRAIRMDRAIKAVHKLEEEIAVLVYWHGIKSIHEGLREWFDAPFQKLLSLIPVIGPIFAIKRAVPILIDAAKELPDAIRKDFTEPLLKAALPQANREHHYCRRKRSRRN